MRARPHISHPGLRGGTARSGAARSGLRPGRLQASCGASSPPEPALETTVLARCSAGRLILIDRETSNQTRGFPINHTHLPLETTVSALSKHQAALLRALLEHARQGLSGGASLDRRLGAMLLLVQVPLPHYYTSTTLVLF